MIERLYVPKGPPWGTRLTELEEVVLAVREYLSEQMIDQPNARQPPTGAAPSDGVLGTLRSTRRYGIKLSKSLVELLACSVGQG